MIEGALLPNVDWRYLDSRITSYKTNYGLKSKSVALTSLVLERLFDCSEDEIQESITDGGNDCGIDAVIIKNSTQECNIHIFQTKYHETIKGCSKNFPSSEVPKILNFLNLTLGSDDDAKKHANPSLLRKIKDIRAAFGNDIPSVTIWLCSNGCRLNDIENEKFLNLLSKYNFITLREIDLEELAHIASHRRRRKSNDKKMKISGDSIFERSDGDIRGIIATIDTETLVNIIRDPANNLVVDKDLFDDNIRVYLGRDNEVNNLILQTLISVNNARFWYMNNGITMLCSSLSFPKNVRDPIVKIKDLQIVNGAQTCNAIFEAFRENPDIVKKASILIKLFETQEDGISNTIAISTNSQTRIFKRDMMSNDIIQRRIQEVLRDYNILYERRRYEYDDQVGEKLDALKAGQILLSFYHGEPDRAKRESDKIFGNFYEKIFHHEISPFDLVFAFHIFKKIEYMKAIIEDDLRIRRVSLPTEDFLLYGSFHVLYLVGILMTLDQIPRTLDWDPEPTIRDAVAIIGRAVKSKRGQAYYSFFRDSKNTKLIRDEAMQRQLNLDLKGKEKSG